MVNDLMINLNLTPLKEINASLVRLEILENFQVLIYFLFHL